MQCPSCQNEVSVQDKDVGALYTCPECRSVYFINFDGTPEYGEVDQPSPEELEKLQNQSLPDKKNKKSPKNTEISEFELAAEAVEANIEAVVEFNEEALGSATEDQVADLDTQIETNFTAEKETSPSSTGQDFASIATEIENFGNDATAVAGISYDLEISGLDTKESQELMREAITDSRFGWHPEDIVREIRTGTCRLKNLTPVQAFVLARRIQFIDVDMKWKQNVLA